jgi:hypothetical protein
MMDPQCWNILMAFKQLSFIHSLIHASFVSDAMPKIGSTDINDWDMILASEDLIACLKSLSSMNIF